MALEAPLRSSTGSIQFPYGNQGDISAHSDTEAMNSPYRIMSSPPPRTDSGLLRPNSVNRISSNAMLSPSDIVGPSPVTSNGTEITEIDDDIAEEVEMDRTADRYLRHSEFLMLATNLPESVRHNPDEAVSVIHAPESFASWASTEPTAKPSIPSGRSSPRDSDSYVTSSTHHSSQGTPPRPPISTDVKPVRYSVDSATPRAQDLRELLNEGARMRSSSTSSLEKIDEQTEAEGDDDDDEDYNAPRQSDAVTALRTALNECWVLCKTMDQLSSAQRARLFKNSGTPDPNETAWKACWKLCQRLYDYQDIEPHPKFLTLLLELCRDFCQALFDVREKQDEMTDSVLRVSFELNNHLYSAHDDRNLPDQFRERTLDFYVTLCHRLMKQKGEVVGETDLLLQACWDLTETLFNLRQNTLDGKPTDEELLDSALQACWDLCDLFKRSCKQMRPDRSTPRPSQATFFASPGDQSGRESRQSNRSRHSKRESVKSSRQEERPRKPPPVPETPVTEFEDTPISPESRSPTMPNIMVLGTNSDSSRGGRWSSSASNLSSYSHNSNRTSSTATTTTATEDPNIARAKILVLRAAMNLGFNREGLNDPKTAAAQLQKFVQSLPAGSFGSLPAHTNLLQQYKTSVLTDAFIPRSHAIPTRGKRVLATEMAKSIQALSSSSPRYGYLRDLFKFVFQFPLDEADARRSTSIVV
ncbi:hypothetical protein PT974_06198 [Cladobotryum mycophilum]|uniref:DUF7624 domain-containing protein n=1 Tax=Cladobotryum mycophilum TaxID=491253 RepID=A0ABR0SKU6_9HYPO